MEEILLFLQKKDETLMVDLAIHLAVDVVEARRQVQSLVAAGQVEIAWRPMKNSLRDLCSCDKEEIIRWLRPTTGD